MVSEAVGSGSTPDGTTKADIREFVESSINWDAEVAERLTNPTRLVNRSSCKNPIIGHQGFIVPSRVQGHPLALLMYASCRAKESSLLCAQDPMRQENFREIHLSHGDTER